MPQNRKRVRVTFDLCLYGDERAVRAAAEDLADTLSDEGFILEEDWVFLPNNRGLSIRTLAAVECVAELIESGQIASLYMVEVNR